MDILNKEYLKDLIENSRQSLNQTFNLHKDNFSKFETVNSFLIDKVLHTKRTNLLITTPIKDKLNELLLPTILTTSLHYLSKNSNSETELKEGDILLSKQDGIISTVKEVTKTHVRILHLGNTKRIYLGNHENYIYISSNISRKIREISRRETLNQRKKGYENLRKKIYSEYETYKNIISYFNSSDIQLPIKNKNKVIIVASKNEILPKIPRCIPFQYINKSGEVYPDTPFDPLLIIVNDFNTVKEYCIEKGVPIDTIAFIGDTKYQQSFTSISKAFRLQKFYRCIFIGTQDIETDENFEVLKWNWTLPEIKYFNQQQYQNLTPVIVSNQELSEEIFKFTNFIAETERRYENLINLKRLLKFIRRIYPITAIGNENRIQERANEIYANFESEAEEIFQDEYYNIDTDYKEDLDQLKIIVQRIINIIKNSNAKANWFKNATNIDYIVVPKSIKKKYEKEIQNCIETYQKDITLNSFENIAELLKQPDQNLNSNYTGLKNTNVITVSEFFQKEQDDRTYLFLSLYGNGIFPDTLLQKIISKNHKTKILCYEEEAKVLKLYLQGFQREYDKELHSAHRELLCGIKYPKTPNINIENIDEWINHLIQLDEHKYTRTDELQYEIIFENGEKTKESESRKVFVEGYDELYKEIKDLKKGDIVRIYRNPDKETLHDIVKLTDEKDLFKQVDYYSDLWKKALRDYFSSKGLGYNLNNLFSELQSNGLSVSKNTLEYWLSEDCKIKFPQEHRDLLAIIKTVQNSELNNNISKIITLKKEYNGALNKAGRIFSDEIDHYILTKEKGKMLNWLSDEHINDIINKGAPLRKVKSIKLIEEEIAEI